jgi:hypothetical protein
MRRLGRFFALPWVLIAIALQGLAPAQALAMPRDAFGLPICSAHELQGGRHRQTPDRDSTHDCCAAACALAAINSPPPPPEVRATFAAPISREMAPTGPAPDGPSLLRPHARDPPQSLTTT